MENVKSNEQVLAMYDVRGIQGYIFRTPKMKEAIGASYIVENLFKEILREAVDKLGITADLDWINEDESGARPYTGADKDVTVLYIGGGNACVVFRNKDTAVKVTKIMSRLTLEKTYSLQLASAITRKTDNYHDDYTNLMGELTRIKDEMAASGPMDAIPIIKVEKKTGFPELAGGESRETELKRRAADKVREEMKLSEKVFDNYVESKGRSSMLAVVHIDGNNMGLRIREMIGGIEDYSEAVNVMRGISFAINRSYEHVMSDMRTKFNRDRNGNKVLRFMKVIQAGDDITYVCNAKIALATVEYFLTNISKYSMKKDGSAGYRFSACAGISYFNSHFPFNIAYNVAESCCESAKERAKREEYKSDDVVGNWFDFQFCRSIHAQNLDKIRAWEYTTASKENLLRRPYFIYSDELCGSSGTFREMKDKYISYDEFKKDMKEYVAFVEDESNIPRSFIKEMRNVYPLGENQMKKLIGFLESRANSEDKFAGKLYFDDEKTGERIARLYDCMEIADYYQELEEILDEEGK